MLHIYKPKNKSMLLGFLVLCAIKATFKDMFES